MAAQGTIVAHVFTSNAMLPIEGAGVAFTQVGADGATKLLAFRTTNFDGYTQPVSVDTPELNGTTLDSSGRTPYTVVALSVDQPGFDRIIVRNAQIFTGIQTLQDLMLIPTPQLPENYSRTETYVIPAQNL